MLQIIIIIIIIILDLIPVWNPSSEPVFVFVIKLTVIIKKPIWLYL